MSIGLAIRQTGQCARFCDRPTFRYHYLLNVTNCTCPEKANQSKV